MALYPITGIPLGITSNSGSPGLIVSGDKVIRNSTSTWTYLNIPVERKSVKSPLLGISQPDEGLLSTVDPNYGLISVVDEDSLLQVSVAVMGVWSGDKLSWNRRFNINFGRFGGCVRYPGEWRSNDDVFTAQYSTLVRKGVSPVRLGIPLQVLVGYDPFKITGLEISAYQVSVEMGGD